MRRTALLLVVLAAACAAIAGDSSGAASAYPSPLYLGSTAGTVTGSFKLDTAASASADSTTTNTPAQNATGWYAFAPGTASTTQLTSIPTSSDGKGWIIDPVGGATGFPAGTWTFTVETDIPDATLTAGAAVLTVGMWKGTISGSAFTATGTLLTPTDDPAAQDLRSSVSPVTTAVSYSLSAFSLAAGETLLVELWRHQTAGINDATAARRELDLVVNDGVAKVAHPAADDTGPTHSLSLNAVSGGTYYDSSATTVYYDGGRDGSFTLGDTITDAGAGPLQVEYPLVVASGWTHADETVTTSPAFTSSAYSWTAGATTSPGSQSIVATDNAQQTSTAALTLTNDDTAPSGQSIALSGGPAYSTLSVPLTLTAGSDSGSGVDSTADVVQRASATFSGGTCGSFGSYSTVTLSSGSDTTVASGNCYRYEYLISDRVGNQSAVSSATADAKVDTSAPTVTDTAPTEVTGSGDQYWNSATDTLWFRPAATGSFILNATATDTESGVTQVVFPDVSGTSGWSGSTGGTDTTSAYSSPVKYTWTAGAAAPGAKTVTATNGTALTGTDTITFSADSTAPTGQTVALAGGPWYATLSVPLTLGLGTDSGSGVDAARSVVERATASLANGSCGTFGAFTTVTLTGGADTTVLSGHCYRYRHLATDNVGNVSTASAASADAKVDASPPAVPKLTFSGLASAATVGTVVYYRPGSAGRFTVTAASSDTDSGIASYLFPILPGFAVSGTGASRSYTFAKATSAPMAPVPLTVRNGAGLSSAPSSFTLIPDPIPPSVTIRCDGKRCTSKPYPKAVKVTVVASDGLGSGVAAVRYATGGKAPTAKVGKTYRKPFSVTAAIKLRVRAYDKAGNASKVVSVTVRSLAARLVFTSPKRVKATAGARYLKARVRTSKKASVTAVLKGPGLKKPERWRFSLGTGASLVQLRLPAGTKRSNRYRLVWSVRAGKKRATKTTRVTLGLPKAKPKPAKK